jgi:hypothetical protein
MKCSIIIAVLDSQEIFQRQMLHFNRIVPASCEVIVVDDGSDPPLHNNERLRFPFKLLYTNDKRPWTQDKARNIGASVARGEYLLMTDIDHILTRKAIAHVKHFQGDMLRFQRRVGELNEQGKIARLGGVLKPAPNIFAIKRTIFEHMGGYEETHGMYGTDQQISATYQRFVSEGRAKRCQLGETIYVITDPKWFHKLKRNRRNIRQG